jgi:hypothetical protein
MKSKITMALIVLGICLSVPGFSQKQKPGKERLKQKQELLQQKQAEIQTERVTFYNSYLELTPAESDKFWPLYNEYAQKQKELKKNHQKSIKVLRGKSHNQLTKEESNELINSDQTLKQSLLDLEKEYSTKFQTAINIQKVAKLKEAEMQFKKALIKKVRENRKQKALEKNAVK